VNRVEQRDALDAGKTPAEKYGNIAEYLDFKRRVWDVKHENQPAPTTWFPTDADANEEEDDDLIIGQEIQSLKCPITLQLLEKPVRNENCVHVYSYDAIKELVRQGQGGRCNCPVTGCNAIVTMKTVREDKAMARRVDLEKNRLEEMMDEGPEDVHEVTEGTSMIVEDLKVE
jgi:SUMO ligase MMS21 Smc5/6 complex component